MQHKKSVVPPEKRRVVQCLKDAGRAMGDLDVLHIDTGALYDHSCIEGHLLRVRAGEFYFFDPFKIEGMSSGTAGGRLRRAFALGWLCTPKKGAGGVSTLEFICGILGSERRRPRAIGLRAPTSVSVHPLAMRFGGERDLFVALGVAMGRGDAFPKIVDDCASAVEELIRHHSDPTAAAGGSTPEARGHSARKPASAGGYVRTKISRPLGKAKPKAGKKKAKGKPG